MYNLEKFCRICIQTGVKLTDVDDRDTDSLKFSEKLLACTQMVIGKESFSTKICSSCIQKLRVSYQFQLMCKKSTSILEHYLTQVLSSPDKTSRKINLKPRRKRIGKDQRCSLLKRLLSKITNEQIVHNVHISGLTQLCDRIQDASGAEESLAKSEETKSKGLQDLLNFTKNYNFGYDISKPSNNFDLTPIDCLTKFTDSFFYDHFGDYRDVILHVRDNLDSDSSDDDELMFEECNECVNIKQEIVIVEPDLNFKKELFYEEEEEFENTSDHDNENQEEPENLSFENATQLETNKMLSLPYPMAKPNYFQFNILREYSEVPMYNFRKHRTLSPNSVKCRTRGNPFINPLLKNQFQMRNFKCSTCNRRFKSPGYLKAHCSKLKHY